jgi:hypothetical protein
MGYIRMNRNLLFLITILCLHSSLLAQSNTVTSGGQASGTGGTVSYSVGQVAYAAFSGSNGYIIQGLQQPFEVSIITRVNDISIDLSVQAYPNPTSDKLILSIGTQELKNLRYQLIDVYGKTIVSDRINQAAQIIDMSKLSSGTYFLSVLSNKKQIRIFKIIKNR